jgi:hypothetical protein
VAKLAGVNHCHNPIKAYTMVGIVRDAGLTVDEFRQLL